MKSDTPVDAEQHGLAIKHKRAVPVSACGSDDARKAIGTVMAVARGQPHALAGALDDQPVAVMLDLVDPLGTVRNFRSLGRDAGFKWGFGMRNR